MTRRGIGRLATAFAHDRSRVRSRSPSEVLAGVCRHLLAAPGLARSVLSRGSRVFEEKIEFQSSGRKRLNFEHLHTWQIS